MTGAGQGEEGEHALPAAAAELIASLVERRAALGLSQAAVAQRMNTAQSAVARLESGAHDPQLSTLERYASALGTSIGISGAPVASLVQAPPDRRRPEGPLTPVQRRILQFIADAVRDHGGSPSVREIGAATGLSATSAVQYQLDEFTRKGYIRRDAGRHRAIELLPPPEQGPSPRR